MHASTLGAWMPPNPAFNDQILVLVDQNSALGKLDKAGLVFAISAHFVAVFEAERRAAVAGP